MVDVFLLVVAIVVPFVLLAGNTYLMAHYMHPGDKDEAMWLKVLVVRRRHAVPRDAVRPHSGPSASPPSSGFAGRGRIRQRRALRAGGAGTGLHVRRVRRASPADGCGA